MTTDNKALGALSYALHLADNDDVANAYQMFCQSVWEIRDGKMMPWGEQPNIARALADLRDAASANASEEALREYALAKAEARRLLAIFRENEYDVEALAFYLDWIMANEDGVLEIPAGIRSLPARMLCGNARLRRVSIPKIEVNLELDPLQGYYSFEGCPNLEEAAVGMMPVTRMEWTEEIEDAKSGERVEMQRMQAVDSRHRAFADCKSLKHAQLADDIDLLCDGCFAGCESLTAITLPPKVAALPPRVFEGCGLEGIDLSKHKIWLIGERAFAHCERLRWAALPMDTLEQVDDLAFAWCKVLEMPDWAADVCSNLSVFHGCSFSLDRDERMRWWVGDKNRPYKLDPESGCVVNNGRWEVIDTHVIGGVRFSDDYKRILQAWPDEDDYEIPETVESIEENAFAGCSTLRRIVIPKPIEGLGHYYDHRGDDVLYDLEGQFYECESLEEAVLPDGLKYIGINMFSGCHSLKKVRLPETLEAICGGAFADTGLETAHLPEKVKYVLSIDTDETDEDDQAAEEEWIGAFDDCEWLREITLPAGIKYFTIKNCPRLEKITIEEGPATRRVMRISNCPLLTT